MQPRENSGDSPARFLAELRALRDQSALSHTELAARAHYPIDVLQAAEVGPPLPDLPVLSAYVRAWHHRNDHHCFGRGAYPA